LKIQYDFSTQSILINRFQPTFIIPLGDNFYYNGIESVRDRQWERTFELVYDSQEMMVPWYPTLGNHDWAMLPEDTDGDRKGNGWAQIEYSAHGSGRWTFPDLFYTIEYTTADDTSVKIIMIETTALTGIHSSKKPGPDRRDPNCKNPYNKECELKRLYPLFPEIVQWVKDAFFY
jgi:tartrate-resistant acid phosphatase type 5